VLQLPRILELRADMRPIFFFALLAVIAAATLPRYMVAANVPTPVAPTAPPAPAAQVATTEPTSSGWRVVIQPDRRGHFRVEGAIDGRRLEFIVDTGASVVTLTESDAARLGFHPAARDYVAQLKTANGTVRAAPMRLGMVEIGGLMLRNVQAVVLPDEALSENLLGLSFLSRLRRFEYREGRLVLED
jgi:aspartyl protease family protein